MNSKITHPLGINQSDCTGCGSCVAACKVNAIGMASDDEGFLYPNIDANICTDCDLCRKMCPINSILHANETNASARRSDHSPTVIAAWHLDDDVRLKSSSGGVFTALAMNILAEGGVVVGAAFDNQLIVRHVLIRTSFELDRLRGSKYVQSEISPDIYRQIRCLLKEDRAVLFSGTSCQVTALRKFLAHEYNKLFCCDILCHGVPSPHFFAQYVQYSRDKRGPIANISFRDKRTGWKRFSIVHHLHRGKSKTLNLSIDPYMVGFLRDYSLRPCCYKCKFKTTVRYGDLTLADFWGVARKYPEYDTDDKGTSLVLINNEKGHNWLNACRSTLFLGAADLDTAIAGNPMLIHSARRPPERTNFYNDIKILPFSAIIQKYRLCPPSFLFRAVFAVKRRVKKVINFINNKSKP